MTTFIKSWKFMAIIAAVLTAVVITLLVVSITTHTEPGLDPSWPTWQRSDFPLRVMGHSYPSAIVSQEDQRAIQGAIDTTNARLGFEAFVFVLESPANVDVTAGAPTEASQSIDPGGDAQVINHQCVVHTRNTGTLELMDLSLQHELGHCLGLAHDDFRLSIMFGGPGNALQPTPAGSMPPWIDDNDRGILRELYAPSH